MIRGNLGRALAKCKHHDKNVWCGAFTPSEVLVLLDNGARAEHDGQQIDYLRKQVKEGKSWRGGSWFYFIPNADLMELLREYHG